MAGCNILKPHMKLSYLFGKKTVFILHTYWQEIKQCQKRQSNVNKGSMKYHKSQKMTQMNYVYITKSKKINMYILKNTYTSHMDEFNPKQTTLLITYSGNGTVS